MYMYMCMAKVPFKVQVDNKLQLASHHPGTWLHSPCLIPLQGLLDQCPLCPTTTSATTCSSSLCCSLFLWGIHKICTLHVQCTCTCTCTSTLSICVHACVFMCTCMYMYTHTYTLHYVFYTFHHN